MTRVRLQTEFFYNTDYYFLLFVLRPFYVWLHQIWNEYKADITGEQVCFKFSIFLRISG